MTITRPLPRGMKIGQETHKDFELRAPLVEDMIEAEKVVDARLIHAFNLELLARVIIRVGSYTGPFTPNMFKPQPRANYNAMVNALLEVEDMGEEVPGAPETSSDVS